MLHHCCRGCYWGCCCCCWILLPLLLLLPPVPLLLLPMLLRTCHVANGREVALWHILSSVNVPAEPSNTC
jgi:hypothetical protein